MKLTPESRGRPISLVDHKTLKKNNSPEARAAKYATLGLLLIAALKLAQIHYEDVSRQAEESARQTSITQAGLQFSKSFELSPVIPRQEDLIKEYMDTYIGAQIGIGPNEGFPKDWNIARTEPVQITISEPQGVWIRDFPDEIYGKRVKSIGSPDGAYYKAHKRHPKPLPGTFSYFVATMDPITKEVSIWAIRWTDRSFQWSEKTGRLEFSKPQLEAFAVYHDNRWIASFKMEDLTNPSGVGTIPGEELFKQAYPQLNLNKYRPKVLKI